MTWGNRNPQPKEKKMNLLNKINKMIDYAIQKARNEGFAEGIKWANMKTKADTEGVELLATFTPKDRCESACCETDNPPNAAKAARPGAETNQQGTTYYLNNKIVTKEVYDNRNQGLLGNDEFTGYESDGVTYAAGTEEFQPDDRYQDYNDAVWPGETE